MEGRAAGMSDGESEDDDFVECFKRPDPLPGFVRSRALQNIVPNQGVRKAQVDLDDFRIAVMKGNLPAVKAHIDAGVHVSQVLRSGWTALMYAASCGRWQVVEYSLVEASDPNFHKELFTPLMAACASSHENEDDLVKCVDLLLEKGAHVNASERHKVTPLMFACKEKRLKIVQTLLKREELKLNLQDNRGWTALMWAADKGSGPIVRLLLEHGEIGADKNLISSSGQKAVDIALIAGHKDVAALLDLSLKPPDPEFPSTPSITEPAVTVTELQTVLMGLDLSSLIPLFSEHKMTYDTFLLLDDGDLDRMGITQVGYRTKLLSAVKEIHTKEWERGSMPAIQYSKYLSCPEATALVGNLAVHARYMLASVAYLRDQIQRKPRILQLGMETASVHALSAQTRFAQKQVLELEAQLKFLTKYLNKVQDKEDYVPADLIAEKKASNGYKSIKRTWTRYAVLFLVAVTAGGLVFLNIRQQSSSDTSAVLLMD